MNPLPSVLRRLPRALGLAATLALLALGPGCATRSAGPTGPAMSKPARGTALPARLTGHFFLVESPQADGTVRRFMVDTGSSATLVSEDVAAALGRRDRGAARAPVRVRGAQGGELTLPGATLRQLRLGGTEFRDVPALVYDFSDLSAHLGLTVDGLLGFPLFREHLLTLDYPGAQLRLAPLPDPPAATHPAPPASVLAFNNERGTPLIPVQMGNESFFVLIDSGSDAGLHLNPTGLHPRFVQPPRPGTIVSSLAGEHQQLVGRLAQNVLLGSHVVREPIVDLTDELSSLGGELLRHFTVTFDQRRRMVTFTREAAGPVDMASRRSSGLALFRSPIYWRVMSVIPGTPTAQIGIQPGDLIIRINGEPVEQWDHERYAAVLATAERVTFTFISGTQEYDVEVPIFELVP